MITTSNLSVGSTPPASGARTTEISNAKRKRLFITDIFYLKGLLARRKFEANPFTPFSVPKRFRNGRHPTDPIVAEVHFVDAHDPVTRLAPVGFAHSHVGSETNDIRRASRRFDNLSRLQTFLKLQDALIDSRELPLRIRIVADFDQPRPRYFHELLEFIAQLLRAFRRDVVFRAGREWWRRR